MTSAEILRVPDHALQSMVLSSTGAMCAALASETRRGDAGVQRNSIIAVTTVS